MDLAQQTNSREQRRRWFCESKKDIPDKDPIEEIGGGANVQNMQTIPMGLLQRDGIVGDALKHMASKIYCPKPNHSKFLKDFLPEKDIEAFLIVQEVLSEQ